MKRRVLERVTYTLTQNEVKQAIRYWAYDQAEAVLIDNKTGSIIVLDDGSAVVTSCEHEKGVLGT